MCQIVLIMPHIDEKDCKPLTLTRDSQNTHKNMTKMDENTFFLRSIKSLKIDSRFVEWIPFRLFSDSKMNFNTPYEKLLLYPKGDQTYHNRIMSPKFSIFVCPVYTLDILL